MLVTHSKDIGSDWDTSYRYVVGGMVLGAVVGVGRCHIVGFYIVKQFRNMGFGQIMMAELQELYDRLTLNVSPDNERALHVYQKAGFKAVDHSGYTIKMEWKRGNDGRAEQRTL